MEVKKDDGIEGIMNECPLSKYFEVSTDVFAFEGKREGSEKLW